MNKVIFISLSIVQLYMISKAVYTVFVRVTVTLFFFPRFFQECFMHSRSFMRHC